MNLVTTNDCRQLEMSCCCRAGVLRFRMSYVLVSPKPTALLSFVQYLVFGNRRINRSDPAHKRLSYDKFGQ